MKESFSFSVVIPFFNRSKFIGKAINSVLLQTYQKWELILVDDGSTDNFQQKLTAFNDSRIKLLSYAPNKGNAYARNLGWRNAKFDWIVFLDSDDWLESNYLSRLSETIEMYSESKFFWPGMRYVNEKGGVIREGVWNPKKSLPSDTFFDELHIGLGGLCINRLVFEQFGGFQENLRASVDREFLLRISSEVMGLAIEFIGVNILMGSHDSVRKSTINQAEAYNFMCERFRNEIEQSYDRKKWWYHKAMWLNLYSKNNDSARDYLRMMHYPKKSLLLFLAFIILPTAKAISLHKKLAER